MLITATTRIRRQTRDRNLQRIRRRQSIKTDIRTRQRQRARRHIIRARISIQDVARRARIQRHAIRTRTDRTQRHVRIIRQRQIARQN